MSNYADYFNSLSKRSDTDNEIDFGTIYDHHNNKVKRKYRYTHPNQLRTMTTHHSKLISHSKQNDLLGALEMLTYKPPQPLPISEYEKQLPAEKLKKGSSVVKNSKNVITKKKPFIIEETENLNKKVKKDDGGFAERQKEMDKQLRDMEKEGVAKVHIDKSHLRPDGMRPAFSRGQNFMNNINYPNSRPQQNFNYPKSKEINTKPNDKPRVATY